MDLFEAARAERLAVHVRDHDRLVARGCVWPTDSGVVFADAGWSQPVHSGHPFHRLTGKVETLGEFGPWKVGDAEFRIIDHGDPLADQSNSYMRFLSMEGLDTEEAERARKVAEEIGFLG